MLPIVWLSFCSVALAAERSPAAQSRQVVLTQLILPNGQPGAGKFAENAAPFPARQVSYNFPQLRPNYVDGFQYYPVFPGQAPVPYGASPFVYYPPGAPYNPAFNKNENEQGWGPFFQGIVSNYPWSNAWGQSSSEEEENEQEAEPGKPNDKKPQKVQQQLQGLQQQELIQQQQQQQQFQQQFSQQQPLMQQPLESQVFYNQQPAAPERVGNTREGLPAVQDAVSAQFPQLLYGAHPQFSGPYAPFNRVSHDPAKLTAASHGAVSNYLFLKNQQQLPVYQQTQQRYENVPMPVAENTAAVGRPSMGAPAKRLELEKYTVDAKNQRSPLYAQHVSALQVSADPATIQGSSSV